MNGGARREVEATSVEVVMPSSSVRTFTDPDEYAAAMRQANVALTVMQRGTFNSRLCRIDLHHLWIQRFSAISGGPPTSTIWAAPTLFLHSRPALART